MKDGQQTPYTIGDLHQKCSSCNWKQKHRLELRERPLCGASIDPREAIEFGGLRV